MTAYAATLWLWHVSTAYDLVEVDRVVHVLEHATLLGFASVFWWRVQASWSRPPAAQLAALPFISVIMLASLALGAGLTFAGQPWFSSHAATTSAWGLTALEDQQVGGLLMLMPATLVLGALLLVTHRAYSQMTTVAEPVTAGSGTGRARAVDATRVINSTAAPPLAPVTAM